MDHNFCISIQKRILETNCSDSFYVLSYLIDIMILIKSIFSKNCLKNIVIN